MKMTKLRYVHINRTFTSTARHYHHHNNAPRSPLWPADWLLPGGQWLHGLTHHCSTLRGLLALLDANQSAIKLLQNDFYQIDFYFRSVCCRCTQYDALRMCIGEELCKKLAELHLFMVGIFSVAVN